MLHGKYALGQRAGLIHHDGINLAQHVQKVGAFEENTRFRGGPDAAEVAQRNVDNQRAGAVKQSGKYRKSRAFYRGTS